MHVNDWLNTVTLFVQVSVVCLYVQSCVQDRQFAKKLAGFKLRHAAAGTLPRLGLFQHQGSIP